MLIKSEIYRILKSKRSIYFIILMMVIPIIDLIINYLNTFWEYFRNSQAYPEGLPKIFVLNPNFASFLSGSSRGHIAQMLLVWILPLYLLVIYCDSYIQDKKIGYNNIVFMKSSRKNIIFSKFIVSFIVPFVVSFISLTINFLLAHILFRGGINFRGHDITAASGNLDPFASFSFTHPLLVNCIYILIYSIVAGGCGLFCTGLSFLFPYYKIVYPLAFVFWCVQLISPFSLTYVMQPFIEYGLDYIIPAFIIYFTSITVIVLVAFRRKVGLDEF
jgi:hypothetical protein